MFASVLGASHALERKQPQHTALHVLTAEEIAAIHDECEKTCGHDVNLETSSMCITNCETEIYQCVKETLPQEKKAGERDSCHDEVLAKYHRESETPKLKLRKEPQTQKSFAVTMGLAALLLAPLAH